LESQEKLKSLTQVDKIDEVSLSNSRN
jgi:hypothetical protein